MLLLLARGLPRVAILATVVAVLVVGGGLSPVGASCPTVTVALDTSQANSRASAWLGGSYGQVFLAEDTLLAVVTVWRIPQTFPNNIPWRLWIANVDSVLRPVPWEILLIGPVVQDPSNDGIHPTRFDFVLDPPFALPHKGHYFVAIKDEICGGDVALLSDSLDAYPFGDAWYIRVGLDCGYAGAVGSYPLVRDLIFELDFCRTDTATGKTTWGSVKRKYKD